jgi:acyl-CoA dehydrogenase
MAWDFETDPEYQEKLDWVDQFVREEVEPLDLAFPHLQFVPLEGKRREAIDPLKEEVRRQGLWATHLGPELGGQGYGQLKLALLNEILGRSQWASVVFGCQAPDTGNAEIIAHYGTDEQKERYLMPLPCPCSWYRRTRPACISSATSASSASLSTRARTR